MFKTIISIIFITAILSFNSAWAQTNSNSCAALTDQYQRKLCNKMANTLTQSQNNFTEKYSASTIPEPAIAPAPKVQPTTTEPTYTPPATVRQSQPSKPNKQQHIDIFQ